MIAGRARTRVVASGLIATAVAALLSGCAAGKQAQTAQVTGVIDADDSSIGDIAIRAIAVEMPPSGNSYAPGSSADLQVVIVNNGNKPDTLIGVRSSAFTGWSSMSGTGASATPLAMSSAATPSGTSTGSAGSTAAGGSGGGSTHVTIGAMQRVSYGVPDATSTLQVTGIKHRLYAGSQISITFAFQRAGSVTALAPVQLTATPGTAAVGGQTSSPAGGGAASEPPSTLPQTQSASSTP